MNVTLTEREMEKAVREQLARDLNCAPDDLEGEKDAFVFVEARENPGRRPFRRGAEYFDMVTMGRSIVISATPRILGLVRSELSGKERDDAFSMPFVGGHSLYYLPDLENIRPLEAPEGFCFELIEGAAIHALYQFDGFHNAIQYDPNDPRPDVLVMLAKREDETVAMAGASADCARMWQIGIDVLPACRGSGLAAYLVNRLTLEILRRGYVPYYGTASSNIVSQRVAHRAGYRPAWVCAYRGRFEGVDLPPTS